MSTKIDISGKYKHFKGGNYTVFCIANDTNGTEYVLYRQNYGDHSFWIRPSNMFFGETIAPDKDGNTQKVPRFKLTGKAKSSDEFIDQLINLIRNGELLIRHSETEHPYVITTISKKDRFVLVHPDRSYVQEGPCTVFSAADDGGIIIARHNINTDTHEGYLTQYELIRRMGKDCCLINNKLEVWESSNPPIPTKQLNIEGYTPDDIKELINPCSIDLRIANSGFLKTRIKAVDPESIEHASKASDLWKKVKIRKSKRNGTGGYFRLWPGQTILTHTASRIKLPDDCAGKIEIKSSYARLSLSITTADFCNPGYDGYFPLEITNHGKHIVYLHGGSVMGQLMLIPVIGPTLEEYSKKATQKNKDGYDDGYPYTFWRERSIKKIRKDKGGESIIALYEQLREEIKPTTVEDVNASKERFDDTFLAFCQNKMHKDKYKDGSERPDVKKLIKGYVTREKLLHSFYSVRWITFAVGLIAFIINGVNFFAQWDEKIAVHYSPYIAIVAIVLVALYAIMQIKKPKAFCTFSKIDVEKVLERIEK